MVRVFLYPWHSQSKHPTHLYQFNSLNLIHHRPQVTSHPRHIIKNTNSFPVEKGIFYLPSSISTTTKTTLIVLLTTIEIESWFNVIRVQYPFPFFHSHHIPYFIIRPATKMSGWWIICYPRPPYAVENPQATLTIINRFCLNATTKKRRCWSRSHWLKNQDIKKKKRENSSWYHLHFTSPY